MGGQKSHPKHRDAGKSIKEGPRAENRKGGYRKRGEFHRTIKGNLTQTCQQLATDAKQSWKRTEAVKERLRARSRRLIDRGPALSIILGNQGPGRKAGSDEK